MKELKNLYETIRLIQHFGGTPPILHVGRERVGKTAGAYTLSKLLYPDKFFFIYRMGDYFKVTQASSVIIDENTNLGDLSVRSRDPFSKSKYFIRKCADFGTLPQIIQQKIPPMWVLKEIPSFIFHYVDKGEARVLYPLFDSVLNFQMKFIWTFDDPKDEGWEKHQKEELERIKGMI